MSRIAKRFAEAAGTGEKLLVSFLVAGDPSLSATETLVVKLAETGSDIIEIGVPFSDPIGEGPTIQRASERALKSNTSLKQVLELVGRIRSIVDTPLILMGYANPFLTMGHDAFGREAASVGVDGVIIPDLPPEEGARFYKSISSQGIDVILLAAPTTTNDRLKFLAEQTSGFLYYASLAGVTGARMHLAAGIEEAVSRVRQSSDIPVCVGFGISRPEHASEIARYADGIVVGSAIVDRIENSSSLDQAIKEIATFVTSLKNSLRGDPKP